MKYFIIFLMSIYFPGVFFTHAIYAENSINTADQASQMSKDKDKEDGAVVGRGKSSTQSDTKDDATIKNKKADDAEFSDYPKSFVIPKGVCETKEPVMVIGE